jgi:hypothetical protein
MEAVLIDDINDPVISSKVSTEDFMTVTTARASWATVETLAAPLTNEDTNCAGILNS